MQDAARRALFACNLKVWEAGQDVPSARRRKRRLAVYASLVTQCNQVCETR